MTVREALAAAAARLGAVSASPRLDAELLMAHALGTRREDVLLHRGEEPSPAAFEPAVLRRLAHEPVAYVTGERDFWTLNLGVSPDVLIPRPDSETLIEAAIAHFGDRRGPRRILDLGTGSGALLLAAFATWPKARGVGVDCSEYALDVAIWNSRRVGLAGRAIWRLGDWGEGMEERFDLILCNPPYVEAGADLPRDVVEFEPHGALFAGGDGLDAYRALAPQLGRLLTAGGIICLEIGAGQEKAVAALMAAAGFTIESRKDLTGIVRCLVLRVETE